MTRADATTAIAVLFTTVSVALVVVFTVAIAREVRGIAADAKARQEAADEACREFKEKQR